MRARSSHDETWLRNQTRRSRFTENVMRTCAGRAGMGGSTSALTFQICLGHSNATHLYLGSCLSRLGRRGRGVLRASRVRNSCPCRSPTRHRLSFCLHHSCRRTRCSSHPARLLRPAAAPPYWCSVGLRAKDGSYAQSSDSASVTPGAPGGNSLSSTTAGGGDSSA